MCGVELEVSQNVTLRKGGRGKKPEGTRGPQVPGSGPCSTCSLQGEKTPHEAGTGHGLVPTMLEGSCKSLWHPLFLVRPYPWEGGSEERNVVAWAALLENDLPRFLISCIWQGRRGMAETLKLALSSLLNKKTGSDQRDWTGSREGGVSVEKKYIICVLAIRDFFGGGADASKTCGL